MSELAVLREGTLVGGKLRVVRLLGVGGMGAVYEVEHELTKHRRALKLLHAEMLLHPSVVARFQREASAAGRIGNAHIVETFDAGVLASGEPYIVMEMLQGETLAARLAKVHRLTMPELVDIITQACDGMQAAHVAGIVHRDLKPENIFLMDKAGHPFVKILDFGISKFDAALTGAHAVTKEGSTIGTPFYMSPEQVNGEKDIDTRTDIYALGVILYECASGKRPFVADALPKLSVLIHQGTPLPLSELRPDLPSSFVDVVRKAMTRDREQRFANARELAEALVPFGDVALDSTLEPQRRVVVQSSPPQARAISESQALGPTMAGSAVSVGGERKSRGKWFAVAGVAAAVLVAGASVVVVFGSAGNRAAGSAPAIQAASPETTATPVPSAVVSLAPIAVTSTSPTDADAATKAASGPGKPIPSAAASTRVDRKGLASDNPFK